VEVQGGRVTGLWRRRLGRGGINVGVCCLHWALLASFSIGERFSLEHDVLVPNVLKEPVAAFTDTSQFIDIGMPKGYQRVQETFAARN
jgi:D-glycero-alpha-D-manno-heptose 1-phosphate guanylyltransferase